MELLSSFTNYFYHTARPTSKGAALLESVTTLAATLGLLALLLHPIFPPRLSRFARLLITPLGLCYGARFFLEGGIDFDAKAYGPIVQLSAAFWGRLACLKVLEWGLVADTTRYAWVGFGPDGRTLQIADASADAPSTNPETTANVKAATRQERLLQIRESITQYSSLRNIMLSTLHLMTSFRGIGYAFGPSARRQAAPDLLSFDPESPSLYVRAIMKPVISSIIICIIGLLPVLPHPSFFKPILEKIPDAVAPYIALILMGGFLIIGGTTLAFYILACSDLTIRQCSLLLPKAYHMPPFDPREYPPLFQMKWRTNNSASWSECWHQLMTPTLKALTLDPCLHYLSPIFGRDFARAMGVLAAFALTGWLHEDHVPAHVTDPLVRYGSMIYFLLQGVGIVAEQLYTKLTGNRVKGVTGAVWCAAFNAATGILRCWTVFAIISQ